MGVTSFAPKPIQSDSPGARVHGKDLLLPSTVPQPKPVQGEPSHVHAAMVDLSRIDASIVTQISSFVGVSRDLLNLALTCKSFGWRQPASTLGWSLVEEAACQTVCSKSDRESVSRTTTWLTILHKLEQRDRKIKYHEAKKEYEGAWSTWREDPSAERGIKLKESKEALLRALPRAELWALLRAEPRAELWSLAHEVSSSMRPASNWRDAIRARKEKREAARQNAEENTNEKKPGLK